MQINTPKSVIHDPLTNDQADTTLTEEANLHQSGPK
jgi:hypothetical protein